MILLWGIEEDEPLALVHRQLLRMGAPVFFLDHREVPRCHVEVGFAPEIHGRIDGPTGSIELHHIDAVYLRPYNFRDFPELAGHDSQSPEWRHATLFEDILWSWVDLADARVLNRPSAMASNNSKPYQSLAISQCGFRIPATLITTSPDAARQFVLERERIYKSISGVRSIVSRLSSERVDALDDVAWCPTQFQEFVPGTDYRVHVIGDELFASRIESEADDYRYGSSRMEACRLPTEIADRCRRLAERLELPFCGIDLRRCSDGAWLCFEVNPSPAYSCFERSTGQCMSGAVARLLADVPS